MWINKTGKMCNRISIFGQLSNIQNWNSQIAPNWPFSRHMQKIKAVAEQSLRKKVGLRIKPSTKSALLSNQQFKVCYLFNFHIGTWNALYLVLISSSVRVLLKNNSKTCMRLPKFSMRVHETLSYLYAHVPVSQLNSL